MQTIRDASAPVANPSAGGKDGGAAQTAYLCSLFGILHTLSASTNDINTPTVTNLLSLLSSIIESHTHIDTYHIVTNSDPSLSLVAQRRAKLDSVVTSVTGVRCRPLTIYERVYVPAVPDATKNELRLWRDLTASDTDATTRDQWHVTFLSKALLPAKHETLVRPIKAYTLRTSQPSPSPPPSQPQPHPQSPQSVDALSSTLEFLGYRFDYEFIREGFLFTSSFSDDTARIPYDVRLYSLVRFERQHDLTSLETMRGLGWTVELSGLANESNLARVEEKVATFAKTLKPIVNLLAVTPES